MRSFFSARKLALLYIMILLLFLILPLLGNRTVTVYSKRIQKKNYVVIDAGHGGVDGGAVSCTGVYESHINLQIALKLEDLMHLLGVRTVMIRDTDRSVYTSGNTIAAQKVSDIRERLRIVNNTPNALYISIHQNNFNDPKYSGAQVFSNAQASSKEISERMQTALRNYLNPNNKRQVKQASSVYMMEHINCTGLLIECGFLSNPEEEALLRDENYQKDLSCVIAATITEYLNT